MTPSQTLNHTPLFDLIAEKKAKFTAFAGWEMPVQFSGLKTEHQAVRTSVGVFDISHMGKFTLKGKQLRQQLQPLVPSDLMTLSPGKAQYTVLLNHQGGIIDDIIFYHQGTAKNGEEWGMMIVNAATTEKDREWLLSHLNPDIVSLTDLSLNKALIALQGAEALTNLQPLVSTDLSTLKAFEHCEATILGEKAFIARTGYTGEDGFEIMLGEQAAKDLWRSLMAARVTPCGLGARDTLRLEAAMGLYGQDMDDHTTPLEAGLSWLVHLDRKGDFIGRDVLEKQKEQGLERRLVGLEMVGRGIARHGYPVLAEGKIIGEVTSGTLSPTLEKAIALAYVPPQWSKVGQALEIEIRGKLYPAKVVKKPFYRSQSRLS